MKKQTVQREQSVVTQVRPGMVETNSIVRPRLVPKAPPKKNNTWVGVAFISAALGLGWFAWKAEMTGAQRSGKRDVREIENMVNKHLIMTNKMIELQQEKAALEYNDSIPAVGDQILPRWKPQQVVGVDHSPDRNELNAVRDLEAPKDLNLNSPDTIIQSEMADAQKKHDYESKYKEEYARRFIENARAGGYEIELDDNFVVRKVRRIPSDESNGLFNPQ